MEKWAMIVSIASGLVSIAGLVSIVIKLGRDKGIAETENKEMRKDIDKNALDINNLGTKVSQMQIENTRLITTLSSDLGWIKSSLADIKNDIKSKVNEGKNA